jgi:hypothetical protein
MRRIAVSQNEAAGKRFRQPRKYGSRSSMNFEVFIMIKQDLTGHPV